MGAVWLEMTVLLLNTTGLRKDDCNTFFDRFLGVSKHLFMTSVSTILVRQTVHQKITNYIKVTEWAGCSSHERFYHLPFILVTIITSWLKTSFAQMKSYVSACVPTRCDGVKQQIALCHISDQVSIFTKMPSYVFNCEERAWLAQVVFLLPAGFC